MGFLLNRQSIKRDKSYLLTVTKQIQITDNKKLNKKNEIEDKMQHQTNGRDKLEIMKNLKSENVNIENKGALGKTF